MTMFYVISPHVPLYILRDNTVNQTFFLSVKISFVLANSVDPDEMSPHATFHLGIPCLPKYAFRSH